MPAENGEHVHSGVRLALQKSCDVITVYLNANSFFGGDGIRLVRSLFEHGREAEKISVRRLINHHFLMIFVNRADVDVARDHDVSVSTGIADFINALARRKFSQLDLAS